MPRQEQSIEASMAHRNGCHFFHRVTCHVLEHFTDERTSEHVPKRQTGATFSSSCRVGHNLTIQCTALRLTPSSTHIYRVGNQTRGYEAIRRFWDLRQATPILNLDLPERVYCADVHYPLALVGLAGRHVIAYNLENGPTEFSRTESPLKYQSRCISIFLNQQTKQPSGFALGSTEGRVAIQYLNPTTTKDNFTFKCHRSSAPVNGYHEIYAVNDMAFHPVHGTLATVGSDGYYSFWDKDARTKLRSSESPDQPLTCCVFDPKGQVFCYASGYDWSKGHQFADPSKPSKIMMRLCMEEMAPSRKS